MTNRARFSRVACLALALMLIGGAALADYGVVVEKNITLYAERTLKTPVATLPRYMALKVKGTSSGVTRLTYRGETVYTKARNLDRPYEKLQDGGGARSLVTRRACEVYCLPSAGSESRRLKKHTALAACGELGSWTLVTDAEGVYYGYVRTSNLEAREI